MKCEVISAFGPEYPEKIEEKLQKFLEANPHIRILGIAQSADYRVTALTIIYEE